jgi:hypothetical protein
VHKAQTDVVQFLSESARLGAFCTADEAYPADSARYMDIDTDNGAVAAVLSSCVPRAVKVSAVVNRRTWTRALRSGRRDRARRAVATRVEGKWTVVG